MRAAAFFDVDGTIAATNIVMPYVHLRLEELPLPAKVAWVPFFLLKAAWYIMVDRFDRSRFNRIFYRNYRGREIETKQELGRRCFEGYLKPKLFPQARARIEELKEQGFEVVLVTGNLDFLMAPLAEELGINHLLAAELEADNGRFTGELKGMPVSDIEKAKRVLKFAEKNDISLDEGYAYGDSTADLPMIESVGNPHAVNPSSRLRRIAEEREYPILEWS